MPDKHWPQPYLTVDQQWDAVEASPAEGGNGQADVHPDSINAAGRPA